MTRGLDIVTLGDGLAEMLRAPAGSAGAVISDLPSGKTKASFDVKADLPRLREAVEHVLHDDGNAVFMCSHLDFAFEVVGAFSGWNWHDLIWEKSNATGFMNANRQPLRAHEHIVVLYRGGCKYNREDKPGHAPTQRCRSKAGGHGENYGPVKKETTRGGKTTRAPRSVLHYASVARNTPDRVHPQQKPVPLMRGLVRLYTNPGDLIWDPYAGSGATGEAALKEWRRFRGAEMIADIHAKANARLRLIAAAPMLPLLRATA